MRRTRGGWLHPSERWRLGELSTERLIGDPAGVLRVSEPGSIWDYLPDEPDVDVNTYHRQYDFGDSRDTDTTNVWTENSQQWGSGGQALEVTNWGAGDDGHASIVADDQEGAYYQYQETIPAYDPSSIDAGQAPPELWAAFEFKVDVDDLDDDNTMFIGFAEEDTNVIGNDAGRVGLEFNHLVGEFRIDQGSGQTWSAFSISLDYREMNKVAFHISWEVDLFVWKARVSVAVNDELVVSGKDYRTSMPSAPLKLTMYNRNDVDGANPSLVLNYIKEVLAK